jgi:hypothetical protein
MIRLFVTKLHSSARPPPVFDERRRLDRRVFMNARVFARTLPATICLLWRSHVTAGSFTQRASVIS